MQFSVKGALTLSLVFLIGCQNVSTDPGPAFSEVQRKVSRRNGQLIQWKTNSVEDAAVEARIQEMLEKKLTADRAVQIALLKNPRIQGIYERLGIAQAQLVQAGLLKNPVFDMSLRFVEGPSNDYIIEMGVVEDFLDVLLIGLRKDLARAKLETAKSEVTGQVINLAGQTQMAFYSYQAALQTYRSNKEITKAAGLSLEAAQRLHKAGNITDLALATERSLYEQTKLELASSQTDVLQKSEKLSALMGLWGADVILDTIPELPDLPTQQIDMNDLESKAIANSLDLTAARQEMKVVAARMNIDTAELVFSEMAAGAEAEREGDGTWSVGPAFAIGIPIFDLGQARTAAGRARLRKLWNDYTALAIEIRSAVRSAKYRLVNARRQANYYKQVIVPLSEQIALETQLQFNAMQLGVFQLLQARQMQPRFKRSYIDALRDYWIARTELELLLDGHFVQQTSVDVSNGGPEMMQSGGH